MKRRASSDRSTGGVSSIYQVVVSNSITLKQLRNTFLLQVHGPMEDASALLDDNAPTLQDQGRTMSDGWLQMTLVDSVPDKPNIDGTTFNDMQDIWVAFLLNTFKRTARNPTEQPGESAPPAAVQFDEQGNAVGVPKAIRQSKWITVV